MTFRLWSAPALAIALCCLLSEGPYARLASAADDEKPKAKTADKPEAVKPEEAAIKLIQEGLQNANKGDMEKASELIGKAVKIDPKNRQAYYFLVLIDQQLAGESKDEAKQNEYLHRSAAQARTLQQVDKTLSPREKSVVKLALFKDACAYAAEKKADKAMASLNDAVEVGYSDEAALAKEKSLEAVRALPDYAALLKKMAEAAKKELAEMVTTYKGEIKDFKSFPFSFELPDVEGKTVKLSDFKGKVTIVDVWGTWCPPCREEIPTFIAMKEKFKDKDFAIVGINYERADKSKWNDIISSFIKENHINYPCVIGDEKTQDAIPEFQAFPTTLFVDREGKVRFKLVGAPPGPVLEAIITVLLEEPVAKKAATP